MSYYLNLFVTLGKHHKHYTQNKSSQITHQSFYNTFVLQQCAEIDMCAESSALPQSTLG